MNTNVRGAGPTLVFAHGVGADQSMWQGIAASFVREFKTVCFDWAGSGDSAMAAFDRNAYASLDDYAADLLALIDTLGGAPISFVGHGVGGLIGLLASGVEPEKFTAHVLVATSPCYVNNDDYEGGLGREDIEQVLTTLGDCGPSFQRIVGAGQKAADAACSDSQYDSMMHFARLGFLCDRRADVARTRTRTLIIQGEHDLLVPVSVGEFMHQAIADSVLQTVPQSGRLPDPSATGIIAQQIRSFISPSAP